MSVGALEKLGHGNCAVIWLNGYVQNSEKFIFTHVNYKHENTEQENQPKETFITPKSTWYKKHKNQTAHNWPTNGT